ncbi:MAG: hypothetical protein HY764_01440 [Candidatus Portnoybacteria bacterium]|nr:hypothetical protein [Candidatus Portnoybacteria bacterium]
MSTREEQRKEDPIQLTWYARAGEWAKKNQADIAVVAGFVLVALISFGVGYLSAPGISKNQVVIEETQGENITATQSVNSQTGESQESLQAAISQSAGKGIIVASKSGTKYHWPWCSWAKQIKPENQVWFNSEAEAQATGYSKCNAFDRLAPAGYAKK